MMDDALCLVNVNQAFCRMLEYSAPDLLGKKFIDLAAPVFRQFLLANQEQLLFMSRLIGLWHAYLISSIHIQRGCRPLMIGRW
jgi:PAS domain S-box-containing protein